MKPTSENGASSAGAYNNVQMVGQEVYKFAVRSVPQVRFSNHKSNFLSA